MKHKDTRLRAVIFDLDETLIRSKTNYHKMKEEILRFLESMGISRDNFDKRMLNFHIMDIARRELKIKGFSEDDINSTFSIIEEIMNRVELETVNEATMIKEADSILENLKVKGLKIGIITNSCRQYAEKVLKNFRLHHLIDTIAARDDVKKSKPDAEHALYVLRLLNVAAEEALFIGDHWLDSECASRAGLRFIHYFNGQIDPNTQITSYYKIGSLKEIEHIITELNKEAM